MKSRISSLLLVALASIIISYCILSYTSHTSSFHTTLPTFFSLSSSQPFPGPTNETLGFGAIYVLAEDRDTWRVQGLRKVASLVGLQLTLPQLPPVSLDGINVTTGEDGSIRAALSHASLLEHFLNNTNHETILILEDDADFDINIKDQMAILSQTIHSINGKQEANNLTDPYNSSSWDILWLGHCGVEYTSLTSTNPDIDPHALPWFHLTSTFNNLYTCLASSTQQLLVTPAAPLCTFAYAITRSRAASIIHSIRANPQSYDVWMHIACKSHEQECIMPVPELFHHQVVGEKRLGDEGEGAKEDLKWYRGKHKHTYNVGESARCNALKTGEDLDGRWRCWPGRWDDRV